MRIALKKAKEIYVKYGNNLSFICREFGLNIIEGDLEGRLKEVYFGDSIFVKKSLKKAEKQELIAHAIGHHLMHAGNHLSQQKKIYSFGNYHERQANAFAAYLLISEEKLEGKLFDGVRADELAEYFEVTEKLMAYRLKIQAHFELSKKEYKSSQKVVTQLS